MHSKTLIIAAAATALLAASCDDVAPADRLILLPAVEARRTVLLEEYTGQMCANCPGAHEAADGLLKQYGDDLIVVGIHGGAFGMAESYSQPDGSFTCLATPEGDALHNANDIKSWPAAIVDRSTAPLTPDGWGAAVRNALAEDATVDIDAATGFNADSTVITARIALRPCADISGASLHVWIVESGIDAFQQDGATLLDHYTHNHVYSGSMTPMPGGLPLPAMRNGINPDTIEVSASIAGLGTRPRAASNLSVAAFVTAASGQVIQAAAARP